MPQRGLLAEEQACGHEYGIKNAVKKCMLLGSLCGLTASIFVYCTAEYVALHLLKNAQTLMALKALALSLPFLSVSGILHGYFTAVRRVVKSASAQFTEIAVRIAATAFPLNLFMPKGLDYACLALASGGAAAEIPSVFPYAGLTSYRHSFDIKTKSKVRIQQNVFFPLRRLSR